MGLATVEPELEESCGRSARPARTSCSRSACRASLPYFFASLKISITLAFVGAVIAEAMVSNEEIGMLIVQASSNLRIPLVFATLTIIAAMSIVMDAGLRRHR
jgi:NitT/TauT family transport system permease protein